MRPDLHPADTELRRPKPGDEYQIYRLVRQSPPLDPNSIYSYHLLCRHFSGTCVVAEKSGDIVGFISAYRQPENTNTLFVWQVVVAENQRGKGLARMMLSTLFDRPTCDGIRTLESTVNPSNRASRHLFESFARQHACQVKESVFLDEEQFGEEQHEKEILLTIGPLETGQDSKEK